MGDCTSLCPLCFSLATLKAEWQPASGTQDWNLARWYALWSSWSDARGPGAAESSEGLVTSRCSGTRQSTSGQFLAKPGDCSLDPQNPLPVFISFPTWQNVLETLTFPHVECTDAQKRYISEEPEATVPGKTVVRKGSKGGIRKLLMGKMGLWFLTPSASPDNEFRAERAHIHKQRRCKSGPEFPAAQECIFRGQQLKCSMSLLLHLKSLLRLPCWGLWNGKQSRDQSELDKGE